MRALDDILIGFFIFFAIDRAIRLFSIAVVEPWAEQKSGDERKVESWKLGSEFVLLILAVLVVFKLRRFIGRLNKA
jgi:protein-S-isoprenylcysteine O-methyltransferase Ste14